ncbi:MAG: DUF72 domain-containing protein [Candidatus Bathyarchaeota archaeon]|nr:DUF72 domain-containing protein [Candidatus Bathyarchaeota archaeon]
MPNLRLGTIGWSYSFWKGNFYPTKIAPKDYLAYYSTQFNTVEVDSTFYRIPTQQTVTNWKQQTPGGFVFSLKFPQIITHVKMLKDCQDETDAFLNRVGLLKEKLGPLLLQFPPSFAANHWGDFEAYLHWLPKESRYVVEVRNKTWLNPEFLRLLRDIKVALAWTDSPLMAKIREVTADFLYIRWEGDRRRVKGTLGRIEVERQADLKAWAQKIKPYLNGQMEVYGYFDKYYSGYPPSDIKMLTDFA